MEDTATMGSVSDPFKAYINNNTTGRDAWTYLNNLLQSYGLGDLNDFTKDAIIQGYSQDEIVQRLRTTDTYKKRFKAIEDRRQAGLTPISESDVINTERAYTQVLQQAGLPSSFYDSPEDFSNLIARDVSPQEMQTRIIDGFTAVKNDPQIQSQLHNLYGMGLTDGDLAAFYLDPERATTLLQQRQTAATIASKGVATGFGQIGRTQVEQLAGLGLTASQVQNGFSTLAQEKQLFNPLESEQGFIDNQTALNAAFNNDVNAQEQIKRRLAERQSEFQGGGSYATSKTGTTGVGSAA